MDVVTGQFTQVGSPLFFVVLVVVLVVAGVIWKRVDKAGFNSKLAELVVYKERLEAQIATSGPEFVASLKADLEKVKQNIANIGK